MSYEVNNSPWSVGKHAKRSNDIMHSSRDLGAERGQTPAARSAPHPGGCLWRRTGCHLGPHSRGRTRASTATQPLPPSPAGFSRPVGALTDRRRCCSGRPPWPLHQLGTRAGPSDQLRWQAVMSERRAWAEMASGGLERRRGHRWMRIAPRSMAPRTFMCQGGSEEPCAL